MRCAAKDSSDVVLVIFFTTDHDPKSGYPERLNAVARCLDAEELEPFRICASLANAVCWGFLDELCRRNGLPPPSGFMSLSSEGSGAVRTSRGWSGGWSAARGHARSPAIWASPPPVPARGHARLPPPVARRRGGPAPPPPVPARGARASAGRQEAGWPGAASACAGQGGTRGRQEAPWSGAASACAGQGAHAEARRQGSTQCPSMAAAARE
jgi:hypothetical protein